MSQTPDDAGERALQLEGAARRGWIRPMRDLLENQKSPDTESLDRAIYGAVEQGRLAAVDLLLRHRPDSAAPLSARLLHKATQKFHNDIVELLLCFGAAPDDYVSEIIWSRGSAIHMALLQGNYGALRLLLQAGADIRRPAFRFRFFRPQWERPIHLAAFNCWGISGSNSLRLLLDSGAPPDDLDSDGRTPLVALMASQSSASQWSQNAVAMLLRAGSNPLLQDRTGHHAFHYADRLGKGWLRDLVGEVRPELHPPVKTGVVELVGNRLLQSLRPHRPTPSPPAAAESNALTRNAAFPMTPDFDRKLQLARLLAGIREHDMNAVRQALECGADINECDRFRRTPLQTAVALNDLETVRYLLDQGARFSHFWSYGTPVHFAVRTARIDLLKLLLDLGWSPRSARPGEWWEPLHEAAAGTCTGALKLLLDKGIGPDLVRPREQSALDCKRGQWRQPLYEAVRHLRLRNVRVLLARGANPNSLSSVPGQAGGMPPLGCLPTGFRSWTGDRKCAERIATLLLQRGADPGLIDWVRRAAESSPQPGAEGDWLHQFCESRRR